STKAAAGHDEDISPKEIVEQHLCSAADWEILSKLILKGHIPLEIPVKYESRSVQEGKKLRFFKDGFAALYTILKIRIFKN
ncbi:MAG: hypothetical protein ABL930_12330, partial [Pseudobdellovibrio sp.]